MRSTIWHNRFLGSTRGKIVALLRKASRTVGELAEALDLTDNAVRAQLATLERDGIIEAVGTRRDTPAARKPSETYDLTAEASEHLFPKAYAPVLEQVLSVLNEHLPAHERDTLLRDVGHRLAASHVPGLEGRSREERIAFALSLLLDLGGVAEVQTAPEGATVIAGRSCPLAATVAAGHPEVCVVAESLLTDIIGAPVGERCRQGETPPRCCFEVSTAPRRSGT